MNKVSLVILLSATLSLGGCTAITQNFAIFASDRHHYDYAQELAPVRVGQEPVVRVEQAFYPIPSVQSCACAQSPALSLGVKKNSSAARLLSPVGRGVALARVGSTHKEPSRGRSAVVVNVKQIQTSEGSVVLHLQIPASKAWDRVSKAITAAGYQLLDRDTTVGVFYILDTSVTGGLLRSNSPIYQVHLASGADNTTIISLRQENNAPLMPEVSAQVLGKLIGQLAGGAV